MKTDYDLANEYKRELFGLLERLAQRSKDDGEEFAVHLNATCNALSFTSCCVAVRYGCSKEAFLKAAGELYDQAAKQAACHQNNN